MAVDELLRAALQDAGMIEDTAVLFLVAGAPPVGAVEYAYLPPGDWGDLEHRVLRDAGAQLAEFRSLHRFGVYAAVEGPDSGIAVGFRHEAQHAVQFNEHGRALFELESILRLGMRRAGRMGNYTLIPTEREANRAAAAYARARYPDVVEALAADARFRQFVEDAPPVANLLDETVDMIWRYVAPDQTDEQDGAQRTFAVVVAELEQAFRDWVPIDSAYAPRRAAGQPLMVELEPRTDAQ